MFLIKSAKDYNLTLEQLKEKTLTYVEDGVKVTTLVYDETTTQQDADAITANMVMLSAVEVQDGIRVGLVDLLSSAEGNTFLKDLLPHYRIEKEFSDEESQEFINQALTDLEETYLGGAKYLTTLTIPEFIDKIKELDTSTTITVDELYSGCSILNTDEYLYSNNVRISIPVVVGLGTIPSNTLFFSPLTIADSERTVEDVDLPFIVVAPNKSDNPEDPPYRFLKLSTALSEVGDVYRTGLIVNCFQQELSRDMGDDGPYVDGE